MTSTQKHMLVIGITFLVPGILALIDASTWPGLLAIWQSPSLLVTDYFTVGGFSAAIANLWLTTGLSAWLMVWIRAKFNGLLLAGLFTIAGFAVFGKNPLNILPIWLGITLYSIQHKTTRSTHTAGYLFGTAIGPIASYFWFAAPMELLPRLVLGVLAGILSGYLIPPISTRTAKLHQGTNLYNVGFSIGIIGTMFTIVLRLLGWDLSVGTEVTGAYTPILTLLMLGLFTGMFLVAWRSRFQSKDIVALLKDVGVQSDFATTYGWPVTLLNMSLLGFLSIAMIYGLGFELHGPMVAGVLTVVGFGAAGKHIINVIPVMLGAFLIGLTPFVDGQAVGPSIAILFVTALAPLSLKYGVIIAMLAGMMHVYLGPIGLFLQGGFALYNNGFVAGVVATLVVQVHTRFLPKIQRKKRTS